MHIIRHNHSEPPVVSVTTPGVVSGIVRARSLVGAQHTDQLRVLVVHFEAGGRNLLHTHSFDQVLYILEGAGIVASESQEHRVFPGDVVVVPAGEQHWHGSVADAPMTHLAFGVPGTTDVGGRAYRATE
jgi:quercetin dioxygenase-like cupin family protein